MSLSLFNRSLLALAFVLIIIFLPWWVSVACGILCTIAIRKYGEIILLGIVADSLYAVPTLSFVKMHMFMLGAIIFFLSVEYIRSRIVTVQ